MRGGRGGVDLSIYGRAVGYLVRNPSIMAMPLLAALVDMLLSYVGSIGTDPLGGLGDGIFQMISQIIYLFAFGVAIIQANNIARGFNGSFDSAWEEGRRKSGNIILAAIGFQFLAYIAQYASSLLGLAIVGIVLQLAVYFFLILTIPAAAIGGLPGGYAISASFRTVREHLAPCLILAVAWVVLWFGIPMAVLYLASTHVNALVFDLIVAASRALVLGYLAFPFATTYDDIAFKLW